MDVRRGDIAVRDEVHPTRESAVRRALALEKAHGPAPVRRPGALGKAG